MTPDNADAATVTDAAAADGVGPVLVRPHHLRKTGEQDDNDDGDDDANTLMMMIAFLREHKRVRICTRLG